MTYTIEQIGNVSEKCDSKWNFILKIGSLNFEIFLVSDILKNENAFQNSVHPI